MSTCTSCRYVRDIDGGLECRLSAPTLIVLRRGRNTDITATAWPDVTPADWCGKYEEASE